MKIAKSIKLLAVFSVLAAFVFSIACSWKSVETTHRFHTQISLHSVSEAQTGCHIISEYLDSLRGVFATAFPETRATQLMLSILSSLAFLAAFGQRFRKQRQDQLISAKQFFTLQNPELFLFNHLKLAFARGILNPKIY